MPSPAARASISAAYQYLYSEARQKALEHWVVNTSSIGFLVHLALIFLSRTLAPPPAILAPVGGNYLSAIYTPFSFILFYEVLMLIAALPHSTTESIAKQYEIVSLIFIRKFFKDIAELDDIGRLARFSPDVAFVFLDVGAGLLMFLLVTVFLHAGRRRSPELGRAAKPELNAFIQRKKAIAVALTVLLISLAAYNLWEFGSGHVTPDVNSFYYTGVFTVMIFTDVLIVILSLAVSDRYELVFRNAAFVISTILIRFSLTSSRPFAAALAISAMLFGIFTLLVYNYHSRIRAPQE
jgi:hypothetical protein